jgi:hypothetical protein
MSQDAKKPTSKFTQQRPVTLKEDTLRKRVVDGKTRFPQPAEVTNTHPSPTLPKKR